MDALRVLLSLAVIGWLMWWIVGTPSRSQGRARALILTVVVLILTWIGGCDERETLDG